VGRSVSYASGSLIKVYKDVSDLDDSWQWEEFLEGIYSGLVERYPSLYPCDKWLGREDKAIAQNNLVYIGVSEYCGLACLWVVPKDTCDRPELAEAWCDRIREGFERTFGEYEKLGSFSNGEAIYRKKVG